MNQPCQNPRTKSAEEPNLFARDQGVMIGNGQIWINEICGSMKIITVNYTR
jgi:hypothetical protein